MLKNPQKQLKTTLWFISELYYPDETSTGYLLTRIAEGLAKKFCVKIVCGFPSNNKSEIPALKTETKAKVKIFRCGGTSFNKKSLCLRVLKAFTFASVVFLFIIKKIKKKDIVFCVTNPPFLPFFVRMACLGAGAKFVLIVHDVYPDVLVAARVAKENSKSIQLMNQLARLLYRSCHGIITLGRDMDRLVKTKLKTKRVKRYIITNWADTNLVRPANRSTNSLLLQNGLISKFVIQYAGNMGLTHDLESLVKAAEILKKCEPRIHFLLVGTGAKSDWVKRKCNEECLINVTLIGNQPRSAQPLFLNACDVAVITFLKGMSGVSVPSRLYNILASGKPIIAMTDVDSELALVIKEEKIGWIIRPNSPLELAQALAEASRSKELIPMGLRARAAAKSKYRFERVRAAYERVVKELGADRAA